MKKLSLFFITCLLSITWTWADTSVTEKFTTIGNVSTGNSASDGDWQGDLCKWTRLQVARRKQDTIHTATNKQAIWLPISTSGYGKINTYNWEGGIKRVAFKYARYGSENTNGRVLQLKISVGSQENFTPTYAKNAMSLGNGGSASHETYSYEFEYKGNAQLAIENVSTITESLPASGICRIMVADLTITPYLLYRQKVVTIGSKQQGYYNAELINNTGGEGTITYSSSIESVATVNSEGVITPVAAGTTTITATWGEVSTTYTLHVEDDIIAENFSQVVQTGQTASATWHGDLFDWSVANVRRGVDDTLGLAPRIQATALRSNTGSTITSVNAIEGGVKHVAFDWRQWASGSGTLNIKIFYSSDPANWGEAVATQSVNAVATASEPHEFDMDIDDGEKGNAYLKLEYTSTSGVGVMGAMKITPYLLYTTKSHTLDTRYATTYTNAGLINNTSGEAVAYTISPTDAGASINPANGEVTVTDETEGDFTVTATWGAVSTTYTLTVMSRTATTASYAEAVKRVGLDALAIVNPLTYTYGYDGTIAYSSSNTAVATVASNGTVSLAGGVGQTTITASLPQTENYKAASASYILYVEDNSANVFVETFSNVEVGGVDEHAGQLWEGDVYNWRVSACGGVRKNDDRFASDQTRIGIWMGTPDPNTNYSSLTTEDAVEGGIKHIWFYCEQPYNTGETGYTLKPVIYLNSAIEANKVSELEIVGTSGTDNIANNRTLFGASNAMKSNSRLIIRNESYKTSDGSRPAVDARRGRFLLDDIHITPWLLYTNKATQIMRIGDTNKRVPDINTTAGESGTLSYSSSDADIASVASDGTVTAKARGKVTITAKYQWSESDYVTTTYPVDVWPVNCETFSSGETSSYYAANEESASGDKATWKARLAGIKTSDFEPYVALIRAPRQGEDKEAYLESSAIAGGIASMTFDWNLVAGEANTTWDIRILINGREVKRLGDDDLAEASKDKMENFGQITIPAINEPGNFIIRFENHSTVNGTYTSGNKARFVIDNICWTNYSGTKTLAENVNNDGWIRNNIGPQNVAISRSELKGGMWNTLCLPFALPVSTLGVVENGVQQLNSASLDGDELTIGFTPYTGDNLVAGTPYLVQPSSDVDISYTYNDVTITSIASPVVVDGGLVTLQGIFSPKELTAGDKNSLFVGTPDENGDNLFYPEVTGNLLGFRAYFKISEGGASSAPAIRRARFIVNEAQSPTALDEADNALQSSRKVLENGHLFIIRDGKKYNVTGQKIQ